MAKKIAVPSCVDCLICGSEMLIYTSVSQSEKLEHESYRACDGDRVECPECHFRGWVSVDDQIAEVNWDETSKHNKRVAERYERHRSGVGTK
jgi:DNA-directed RNA polymerase subunit RPC12/RpoP